MQKKTLIYPSEGHDSTVQLGDIEIVFSSLIAIEYTIVQTFRL